MREFMTGVLIGVAVLLTVIVVGAAIANAEPAKVLVIDDVITDSAMAPLNQALREVVVAGKKQDVVVVISSPGGSVDAGMTFINLMGAAKAQGSRITCYVQDLAMSMAFQIFTQCTRRFALPTSQLLWHGVRITTNQAITAELAESMQETILKLNELFKYQLYPTMKMPRSTVDRAFVAETLWTGIGLKRAAPKFLTLLSSYPGVWPRTAGGVRMAQNPFGGLFSGVRYEVVYIWPAYRRGTK